MRGISGKWKAMWHSFEFPPHSGGRRRGEWGHERRISNCQRIQEVGALARGGVAQVAIPALDHRLQHPAKLRDFHLSLAKLAKLGRGHCTHAATGYAATLTDTQHTRQLINAEADAQCAADHLHRSE